MNDDLTLVLETDFDHWITSPDETKVVAWKNHGKSATVFDTKTGEKLLSIDAEMDKWFWSPSGKDLISHDYIVTHIWDATTGKFLRSVEAMYDRSDK
jgi:hypothetical protein